MKTKKRNLNQEPNLYKKKINTRTMNSRNTNDSITGLSSSSLSSKSSPNTRAKTNCVIKSHSDPYAFSKMDEEEKIPLKKIKITEKEGKEVGVNTSSFSTMTEPEYLGPCEPGTSIELQGIVWLETTTGLLVINVTWRGRTYVGTLMDSTKYEFTPTFSQENLGKFESPQNRPTRGKKRQVGNPGNYFSLRSNNIRHSSRLNESINSPSADNAIKKLSTRQTNNLINYFESANQSATASASGDSDTDKNSYSKFSISSKTRSVTRSITKLNKAALQETNSNSADDNNGDLVRCTRINCFKRFVDMTAYQYHVQRTHDAHDKADEPSENFLDTKLEYDHITRNNCIKLESVTKDQERSENGNELHTQDSAAFKTINCKLNNLASKDVKNTIDSFEFNSDSETEKNQNSISFNYSENKGDLKISENELLHETDGIRSFIKSENLSPQFQELSITLPKVSDMSCSEILQSTNSSSITEAYPCGNDKLASLLSGYTTPTSKPLLSSVKTLSQTLSASISSSPAVMIPHSSSINRTVSAPTVSIPVELVTTQNNLTTTAISCPTLIRPKPNQNPITSLIHSSQNRKFKSSKSFSQQNGVLEPFQIPSSSPIILKKRPLVPLKVAVNQNTNSNINRMYSMSSQINVSSSSSSSRQIRSSSISPVTPILPATSTTNHATSSVISTSSTTGSSTNCSANNILHNGQLTLRRPSGTSNTTAGSGLPTLVNLKPIQPKPKNSQFPVPITTSQHGMNASSFSVSQSLGQNVAGMSNIHVSHQRQILPSPISKSDCNSSVEESLIHKIESLKTSLIKRKRRKPEKKIRINFHESNRFKKFTFNAIQPKHATSKNNNEEFCLTNDKYKTDEENSHSPGYSDLSETNDTPAPILEKEIDLKTGECDKLVICTDFDSISIYRHNSSSSDNYDDPKDLSNKPPALMPAVLSSDLVNGSTNELDYRDVKPRPSRKKSLVNKKTHKLKEVAKGKMNVDKLVGSEWINISSSRSNNLTTPNRKSFQLSSAVQQNLSSAPLLSPQSSVLSLPVCDYATGDQNTKFVSVSRSSITSAVSVRTGKINYRDQEKANRNKLDNTSFQTAHNFSENSSKIRNKHNTPSPNNNNGKFSVQALTSPQDIVSRSLSFSTSSSVSTIIPNSKLSNALFKN